MTTEAATMRASTGAQPPMTTTIGCLRPLGTASASGLAINEGMLAGPFEQSLSRACECAPRTVGFSSCSPQTDSTDESWCDADR